MPLQLGRNYEEQLARRKIAQISVHRTRAKARKIIKPDLDMTLRPYVRRPIDFDVLDRVGHGEASAKASQSSTVPGLDAHERRFASASAKATTSAPMKLNAPPVIPGRKASLTAPVPAPRAPIAPIAPIAPVAPVVPGASPLASRQASATAPVTSSAPAPPPPPPSALMSPPPKPAPVQPSPGGPIFTAPPPPPSPPADEPSPVPPPPPPPPPSMPPADVQPTQPPAHEPEEEPKALSMSELRARLQKTLPVTASPQMDPKHAHQPDDTPASEPAPEHVATEVPARMCLHALCGLPSPSPEAAQADEHPPSFDAPSVGTVPPGYLSTGLLLLLLRPSSTDTLQPWPCTTTRPCSPMS